MTTLASTSARAASVAPRLAASDRARHAPVETPNSYWDMSGFGTAAHADGAESEGLAKSPTPKSLL